MCDGEGGVGSTATCPLRVSRTAGGDEDTQTAGAKHLHLVVVYTRDHAPNDGVDATQSAHQIACTIQQGTASERRDVTGSGFGRKTPARCTQ